VVAAETGSGGNGVVGENGVGTLTGGNRVGRNGVDKTGSGLFTAKEDADRSRPTPPPPRVDDPEMVCRLLNRANARATIFARLGTRGMVPLFS
jgi:hypothetical protein